MHLNNKKINAKHSIFEYDIEKVLRYTPKRSRLDFEMGH
jgi:hypothetical protein